MSCRGTISRLFFACSLPRARHTHTHDRNGRKRDVQPTHRNVARGTINRGTAISSIRFACVTNSPSPLLSRDTLSGPRIFYKSRFRDRFIAPPLTRYTRVETLEERAKHRVPLFVDSWKIPKFLINSYSFEMNTQRF